MSNIFEKFREYQSRKVDNPEYKPLGQPILEQTPTKEDVRKAKRREYLRKYYEKNKEKMREYQREYHRKHSNKLPQKYWLKWVQLDVYNYMVEQYQLWDRVPRWTQIAKALNIWEQTVYNAVFSLVKKWLVGRWQVGKYYLINPPIKEEDEVKKELEVVWETFDEPEMVYVEEDKYDEILKENESLKKLKDQNTKLTDEVIMLRKIVKYLSRYID